ncbi:FtsX-like permease family protein [Bifidobacterium callimiconis]|uniref:FtsX-like permease family protein n=1 Tax=Bifidobacterium callimiconis TaxID=2306973 RepID=UPI001BDD8576|nr:FtsX-like permease family protein [Bifidobacterium callimiconis]MBT1176894.1 FtsX-like permease family protein [Bifidobacterium callimiconis]
MFVLKNTWAAMGRHKAQTILLALTAVAVSFGSVVGLSILDAANTATTTTYNALTPSVMFRVDRTRVIAKEGGDASKVDWTKYNLSWENYSTYVEKATNAGVQLANAHSAETAKVNVDGVSATKDGVQLAITGFSDADAVADSLNGSYTVVKGKDLSYDTNNDENAASTVLVPQALATKNNLKVGDTIKLVNPSDSSQTLEVKISGIYKTKSKSSEAQTGIDQDNTILASTAVTMSAGLTGTDTASTANLLDIAMVLQSPSDYTKFEKAVRKAGLSKDYTITSPTIDKYNDKIEPLKNGAAKVRVGVIAMYVAGGVIALLLLVWGIGRARTGEVSFLTMVGVTRGRIGWQFSLENLLPILVGWLAGAAGGFFAAKPLSNALAAGTNASVAAGTVWTVVWIGLGALAATLVICLVRANLTTATTMLGSRMEETR